MHVRDMLHIKTVQNQYFMTEYLRERSSRTLNLQSIYKITIYTIRERGH